MLYWGRQGVGTLLFFIMELETLLRQRESYAGKILKIGVQIAIIFLIPALIGVVLSKTLNISFLYFLPGAFIISWVFVFYLYRKIKIEMKKLDNHINELRKKNNKTKNT